MQNSATAHNLSQETIDMLQDLIQVNIDSRDGFREAADNVSDVNLSSMFRELAAQRDEQSRQLQALVAGNREQPQQSGSVSASMHRTWMDLRSAFGGGAAAMLQEAERGEDHIRDKYRDALQSNLDTAVVDILQRHAAAVQASHDRVRDLRDHYNEQA